MYVCMCACVELWVCTCGNRKRAPDSLELTTGVCELHDVDAGSQSSQCPSSLCHLSSCWSWIPPPFPPWPISTGTQHWINMSGMGTSGTLSQSETVLFKVDCPGCFLYREKAGIQVRCFCADRCPYITYKATATLQGNRGSQRR